MDGFIPESYARVPAAILVHGGGWIGGDRVRNVEPLFFLLQDSGVAWFSISYTLAKDILGWGAGVDDVRAAISFVQKNAEHYHIDASRIFVIGESAGAQLAALAAWNEPKPAVRAVVAFYMPANLEEIARSSRYLEGFAGSILSSSLAGLLMPKLRDLSPASRVRAGLPPLLLIHGDQDSLVPFSQSESMCRAVRKAGGKSDLIAVRGGAHGLRRWESAGLTGYRKLLIQWMASV